MRIRRLRRQRGMSILEIIIGTAFVGMILASTMVLMNRSENETRGRNNADNLGSFQQLAAQYFIANRTEIEAAMAGDATKAAIHCLINVAADGTGGTVVTNSAKHTCAFDSTFLRAKGLWPTGSSVDVDGVGRWVAVSRQMMTGGATPVPTGADEVLIVLAAVNGGNILTSGAVTFVGDVRRSSEEIGAGMAALGASGGFIPPGRDYAACQYNATTKQACGTGWVVSLDDFIN